MADFEDANTPTWDNNIQGQINLRDAIRRRIDLRVARRQGVQAEREDRRAVRAPARLAPAREARAWSTAQPISGGIFDFALYFFHNAKELRRARQRPVLLPAEAGEPSRGAAVERHLRDGAGRARRAARHDQGDGADRDDPRRVRDGRDPLRAARALGRAQLRPLGLHLLVHQEVPAATRTSASPTARWSR